LPKWILYVHPYSISSYHVVDHLLNKGLLNKLTIIPLTSNNIVSIEKVIPGIPALEVNGKIVAIDPLEPQFVEGVIRGLDISDYIPESDEKIIKRFVDSVRASSYVSIKIYFGGLMIEHLINSSFTEYALRTYYSKKDIVYIRKLLMENIESIKELIDKTIPKIVAINYLRDLVVSRSGKIDKGEALDLGKLMLWSIAKNSMGRAFIPLYEYISGIRDRYYVILDILKEKFNEYYTRIINEYSRIRSNEEVYKILTRGTILST